MTKTVTKTQALSSKAWILLGIPVLFIVGGLMHFAYEASGNKLLAGLFAPINESIWEHLKMAFWPTVVWWLLGYFLLSKTRGFSTKHWFVSCAISAMVSPLVIVAFYYTYTGAFGIESLVLDIFSLLLGLAIGQLLALHIYTYATLKPIHFLIAL
ncbi:MAG: hypothetical protein H7X94_06495, partial [Vallitaleaceae bacterium]|nr:hypothetical protein [Vallitaleaceae bacterium]